MKQVLNFIGVIQTFQLKREKNWQMQFFPAGKYRSPEYFEDVLIQCLLNIPTDIPKTSPKHPALLKD